MDKFQIDPKSPIPVWAQTKNRLLYLIMSGHYKEGEKLPTVRDLAVELGINYNTANKAYQDLERDGYVYTVRGKGCFVADKIQKGFFVLDSDIDFLMQELIAKSTNLSMTGEELVKYMIMHLKREGKISDAAADNIKKSLKEAM